MERGTAPYFYLPKLERHLEARLWNDVFVHAQRALGVPNGTIRATVLIETLPAAFEMHEILHELRDHAAGLNCGRWDYIFSFIKKHRASTTAILPDRAQITMDKGFLRAYSQLLIRTCHAHGVHAMGGMAAQIPIKDDAAKNDAALARVRADKTREAGDGHDGTWVAHPGLVPVAMEVFDAAMPAANQIDKLRLDVNVGPAELLGVPAGTRTEEGLRHDVRVGIQYVESWLRGVGCVPLYDLMEDAATAEISRALVWQWLHHEVAVGGAPLTTARYRAIADEETKQFTGGRFADARALFDSLSTAPEFADFLTIPAYARIVHDHS
jgi:malate synthase A